MWRISLEHTIYKVWKWTWKTMKLIKDVSYGMRMYTIHASSVSIVSLATYISFKNAIDKHFTTFSNHWFESGLVSHTVISTQLGIPVLTTKDVWYRHVKIGSVKQYPISDFPKVIWQAIPVSRIYGGSELPVTDMVNRTLPSSRRRSNYIFILDLTPGCIGLGKDSCMTGRGYLSLVIWCVLYSKFYGTSQQRNTAMHKPCT